MSLLTSISAALLIICGIYLTIKSGFFQLRGMGKVTRATFGKLIKNRDYNGFKAMAVALGSTIGIGNIIGVAAAISIGGAGSIFWMLVSGFLGMIIKYAEIHICVEEAKESHRKNGGPMYVIRNYARGKFKIFGAIFAIFCIMASFFAGNLMQSKSIFEFSMIGFGIGKMPITLLTLPFLYVIISGKDRIYQNFSAIFVPIMSLFYIFSTLIIIFNNIANVPFAVFSIFTSAFGFDNIAGGFCGTIVSRALSVGVMKGLFTNEAGLGSSPIAHSSAKNADGFTQGCWGIVEVFVDTVVVCMLTAIAVLSSPIYLSGRISDPFILICEIFRDTFGSFGLKAISASAYCFAFAALVGWAFYGIKSVCYFSHKGVYLKTYIIMYLFCIPLSCILNNDVIWALTDVFNSFMLIPNVVLLLFVGGKAVENLKQKENSKSALQTLSSKMRCIKN